jgi:hypothetical protein
VCRPTGLIPLAPKVQLQALLLLLLATFARNVSDQAKFDIEAAALDQQEKEMS